MRNNSTKCIILTKTLKFKINKSENTIRCKINDDKFLI